MVLTAQVNLFLLVLHGAGIHGFSLAGEVDLFLGVLLGLEVLLWKVRFKLTLSKSDSRKMYYVYLLYSVHGNGSICAKFQFCDLNSYFH